MLSFDEKTQVQALNRTQPLLPIDFGKTEKRTHDYVRHGTTNLFAALEVHTGQVHTDCFPRRRTSEFLSFMDKVSAAYPAEQELHVIMDNLSTHSGPDVDAWLAEHPNVRLHYTPTGSSWMNMVEIWLGIITRQATAGHVHLPTPPHPQDRGVRSPLERQRRTLRVDRDRRRDPREGRHTSARLPQTPRQQLKVNDHHYTTLALPGGASRPTHDQLGASRRGFRGRYAVDER